MDARPVCPSEAPKKQLEVRLLEINAERDSPIGGQGYDPLPRSGGNNEGAAGILMKLADIEDRIYEQKAKADKSMVSVATILNFYRRNLWSARSASSATSMAMNGERSQRESRCQKPVPQNP